MQVTVIGRHLEATDALKQYATERFQRLEKYLPRNSQATITLSVVKKVHHIAEAMIKADGLLVQATEETEEMYSSIDLLYEKLERQGQEVQGAADGPQAPDRCHRDDGCVRRLRPIPRTAFPQIIKTKRFDLKPMHARRGRHADGAPGQAVLHLLPMPRADRSMSFTAAMTATWGSSNPTR